MSTKERKALGRGFSALLKSVDTTAGEETSNFLQVRLSDIALNPKQPRTHIDPTRLEELAQSIRIKGVIQPILLRRKVQGDKKYELIAGERRFRASKLAGYDKVPSVIKQIKDQDVREIALIENIQRDNLNPIEESTAYRDLLEEHGYTQEDLAKRVGKSRSTIANMIRLLQLPAVILQDVLENNLSASHARALLTVESPKQQEELHQRILNEKLSVRDTERLSRNKPVKQQKKTNSSKAEKSLDPQMQLNQDRLQELYTSKVNIKAHGNKGKIEVEFYDAEDFNRIFALMLSGKKET
ncbi:MAG: chromosome partitioning protein ParB [SAR324 cluster bacterium]|uniref:Chromosome partitioning protein ParB n=1 Tax=SAR324 cluster bacterium TaxID=2024889 RepID=A0A2A4TAF6_9DELT|nr:MAG: chromosome partitioning protein ParB [SAR324 cluster bacterium]